MPKLSLRQKFCAVLEHKGYKRNLNSRTRRFIVYDSPTTGNFVYVGKNGGIRIGRSIAGSRAAGDNEKAALLKIYDEEIEGRKK